MRAYIRNSERLNNPIMYGKLWNIEQATQNKALEIRKQQKSWQKLTKEIEKDIKTQPNSYKQGN